MDVRTTTNTVVMVVGYGQGEDNVLTLRREDPMMLDGL